MMGEKAKRRSERERELSKRYKSFPYLHALPNKVTKENLFSFPRKKNTIKGKLFSSPELSSEECYGLLTFTASESIGESKPKSLLNI